jgi:hypothetical protein
LTAPRLFHRRPCTSLSRPPPRTAITGSA